MSLSQPGKTTSGLEVSDISVHGIWMLIDDAEYFLSHEDFPWFKDAPVAAVFNVQRESAEHFRWPDLDVDLCLESIQHPERFPLKYKPKRT